VDLPISQNKLLLAGAGATVQGQLRPAAQRTAFLCHSHKDRKLALGLQALLRSNGVDLYIDWQDGEMPPAPNAETAQRLRSKIASSSLFLYLATQNSATSRWCPWELGHADGVKNNGQIVLVPTHDGATTHGAEYLNLYRRIDANAAGTFQVFSPAQSGVGADLRTL
jgi:hypothetical protein